MKAASVCSWVIQVLVTRQPVTSISCELVPCTLIAEFELFTEGVIHVAFTSGRYTMILCDMVDVSTRVYM